MRSILVEPELLETTAARMEEENQNYQRIYGQLFESVDTMRTAWEGKDNTTFTSQIKKFEGDFRELSVLCTAYSEFLRNSARAYRETQDEVAGQASHLVQ